MAGPGAGGGGAGLRRFRRLADLTAVVTFLLILVGGVVRVSDSGLGCGPGGSGTKGWPLCGGDVVPLVGDENTFIEFSHRLLAAVVVVLIAVALLARAIATLRNDATVGPSAGASPPACSSWSRPGSAG
jgi:heme A synthase